VAKGTHH
jgi:hypothetical protein